MINEREVEWYLKSNEELQEHFINDKDIAACLFEDWYGTTE